MQEFKVILIGSTRSGKSSIMKRVIGSPNIPHDVSCDVKPTKIVQVHPIVFETNHGQIQLNVWDCSGAESESLMDGYWIGADACIGVVERGKKASIDYLRGVLKNQYIQNIPVVHVVNKSETNNREYYMDNALYVSAKNNTNCLAPFQEIARQLTGHADLVFC
jgi:GTPase SAR1 family protein